MTRRRKPTKAAQEFIDLLESAKQERKNHDEIMESKRLRLRQIIKEQCLVKTKAGGSYWDDKCHLFPQFDYETLYRVGDFICVKKDVYRAIKKCCGVHPERQSQYTREHVWVEVRDLWHGHNSWDGR